MWNYFHNALQGCDINFKCVPGKDTDRSRPSAFNFKLPSRSGFLGLRIEKANVLCREPETTSLDSLDGMDRILDQFLAYGQTTTSLIQSSPVPPRGLPLPE
jgi:hypothetical protein